MTVVLHSSELELFLRQADLRQPRQRFAIARRIADLYVVENPYRARLLTFQDPISWASFRWLYHEEDFRRALACNVHERSPGDISYTFILERRPPEDTAAKGCLRVKQERKLLEHQEWSNDTADEHP